MYKLSCGNLGIRNASQFSCPFCSFQSDSDFNASKNIALRAIFNSPIVTCDDVKGSAKNNCDGAQLQATPL